MVQHFGYATGNKQCHKMALVERKQKQRPNQSQLASTTHTHTHKRTLEIGNEAQCKDRENHQ